MAVTIKDIAKKLNISVSTVSYALNGGPRPVPEEVKARVFQTAQQLGYRPNRNARSLITKKSNAIGVIPSSLGENIALSPFFIETFNGVVNEAESLHYDIIFFTRYDQSDPANLANDLLDGRVDALVFIAPPIYSEIYKQIETSGIPAVAVGAEIQSKIPTYNVDNACGVALAMQHLVDLGHRKIGHIAGLRNLADSIERESAVIDFLANSGLQYRPEWFGIGNFIVDDGYEAALKILRLKDRPTAIFCANDEIAIGAIRAAHELGIRIPTDLSLVGFDGNQLGAYTWPRLTTVRHPVAEIASAAMRALVDFIEWGHAPKSRLFKPDLTVRESTARPLEDKSII